jgi:hypothetical protein
MERSHFRLPTRLSHWELHNKKSQHQDVEKMSQVSRQTELAGTRSAVLRLLGVCMVNYTHSPVFACTEQKGDSYTTPVRDKTKR